MDNDIFYILYNYLEERHYNNIYQNAKQDADYLKTTQLEKELYINMNLLIYPMNNGISLTDG